MDINSNPNPETEAVVEVNANNVSQTDSMQKETNAKVVEKDSSADEVIVVEKVPIEKQDGLSVSVIEAADLAASANDKNQSLGTSIVEKGNDLAASASSYIQLNNSPKNLNESIPNSQEEEKKPENIEKGPAIEEKNEEEDKKVEEIIKEDKKEEEIVKEDKKVEEIVKESINLENNAKEDLEENPSNQEKPAEITNEQKNEEKIDQLLVPNTFAMNPEIEEPANEQKNEVQRLLSQDTLNEKCCVVEINVPLDTPKKEKSFGIAALGGITMAAIGYGLGKFLLKAPQKKNVTGSIIMGALGSLILFKYKQMFLEL